MSAALLFTRLAKSRLHKKASVLQTAECKLEGKLVRFVKNELQQNLLTDRNQRQAVMLHEQKILFTIKRHKHEKN